jgi:hypothetical protein
MQRVAVLSLAILLCLAAVAQANPDAWFGTSTYTTSVTQYTSTTSGGAIDLQIYVGENTARDDLNYLSFNGLPGIDLYAVIGPSDGTAGPTFATGTPVTSAPNGQTGNSGYVINGGDPITGTVFAGNHSPAADNGNSSSQILQIAMNTSSGVVSIPNITSGGVLLATLHIVVPSGLPAGSDWSVTIDGSNPGFGVPLDFTDGNAFNQDPDSGAVVGLYNANIHIVPEPASVVLGVLAIAGLGLVALRRRRAA